MTDRYADIKTALCAQAEKDDDIRAVIAIGSSVRKDVPADDFSDLDLMIVTRKPEVWHTGEYPAKLGRVSISFIEPTLGGGMERRCIYDEDRDVDMLIFTPELFDKALKKGEAAWVMNRGYSLLCDKDRLADIIPQYVRTEVTHPLMDAQSFYNMVNDFYFHNIWACKKLRRGELWSAKMCIDGYLKELLLRMAEQYMLCSGDCDVWHDGRFFDKWADSRVLDEVKNCFAHYDTADCKSALVSTHRLFKKLAASTAEKLGHQYPKAAEECAARYLGLND